MAESRLERTRRQIAETDRRIDQQSCLVTRLRQNGHDRTLREAERFLARLILVRATFEARLLPAARDYFGELQRYQEGVETCLWQLNGSSPSGRVQHQDRSRLQAAPVGDPESRPPQASQSGS
jgi:hypothetical protein